MAPFFFTVTIGFLIVGGVMLWILLFNLFRKDKYRIVTRKAKAGDFNHHVIMKRNAWGQWFDEAGPFKELEEAQVKVTELARGYYGDVVETYTSKGKKLK